MKAVGIKVLKARLSEYIRRVRAGETVLVTDRDEVVAELRPARRQSEPGTSLAEHLASLADRGEATLRSSSPAGWTPPEGVDLGGIASQPILDALREETR